MLYHLASPHRIALLWTTGVIGTGIDLASRFDDWPAPTRSHCLGEANLEHCVEFFCLGCVLQLRVPRWCRAGRDASEELLLMR